MERKDYFFYLWLFSGGMMLTGALSIVNSVSHSYGEFLGTIMAAILGIPMLMFLMLAIERNQTNSLSGMSPSRNSMSPSTNDLRPTLLSPTELERQKNYLIEVLGESEEEAEKLTQEYLEEVEGPEAAEMLKQRRLKRNLESQK